MSDYSAELSESKFATLARSDNAISSDVLLELASVLPGPWQGTFTAVQS